MTLKTQLYTMVDVLILGAVAAIYGVLFYAWWSVYYAVEAVGGPIAARLVTYGLWFMPAPLAASLIRKVGSAFLGELLPALLESIIPTPAGLTNAIYGAAQGAFSEAAYAIFGYRRFGVVQSVLAGALAGIPAVALDAILYGEVFPFGIMVVVVAVAMLSGAIYGALAYMIARSVKP